MPRVAAPPPPRVKRPAGPPPRRTAPPPPREPRNLTNRPRGWMLALRRARRRAPPILLGTVLLGMAAAGLMLWRANSHEDSLVGLRARFGSAAAWLGLRVEKVVVQGHSTTPQPLLDAAIGVSKGDPLLSFSVSRARERLVTLASVSDATVERRWPSTVLVSLVERHPFAVWQNHGQFVLIDHDGQKMADQDVRLAGNLPLVVGAGAPASAGVLIDAIGARPAIRDHLQAATRVGDRRWNLLMTSGATVMLPQDGQEKALDRLALLQQGHAVLDRPLRVIDLRNMDRMVLRPAAAAPAAIPGASPASPAGHPPGVRPAPPPVPSPAAAPAVSREMLIPAARSVRRPT